MSSKKSSASRRAARLAAAEQSAAIRAEHDKAERRRRRWVVGGVVATVLVALLGIGYAVQSSRDTSGQSATVPSGTLGAFGVPRGDASAPVTVTVYEDFMCPFCGEFEQASRDRLEADVAAGDVAVDYRVVSFLDRASDGSEYSTRAMNALGAVLDTAGPEVAVAFHDALYAQQPEEGSAGLSDDELIALAVTSGADRASVEAPIRDRAFGAWVANATDQASKDEVNQTPTILVDGSPLEAASIDGLVAELGPAVEAARG